MGGNVEDALRRSNDPQLTEIEAPVKPRNISGLNLWQRLVSHGLLLKDVHTGKVVHVICDHSLENIEQTDELMNASIIIMDGDETYGCYGIEHPIDSRMTRDGTMVELDNRFFYILSGKPCVLK